MSTGMREHLGRVFRRRRDVALASRAPASGWKRPLPTSYQPARATVVVTGYSAIGHAICGVRRGGDA
jgi:hypothetical protein